MINVEKLPFNATTFFRELRTAGVDPTVTVSGYGYLVDAIDPVKAEAMWAWAHKADPDQKLQRQYVREKWESRPVDQQIVSLG
jgi:hypothetical protein